MKQQPIKWLPYYGSMTFFIMYWLLALLGLFGFFLPFCGTWLLNVSLLGSLIF